MHGVSIQITWIVLSVIAGMFIGYMAVRAICYFLVRANLVPCKKRLSDIRLFQNDAERARAKIIASGLEHKFKEGIPSFTMVGPQFVAAVMNDDHTSIEIEPPRTEERHPRAHWPVFRLAVDGRIGTSSLVVSDVPDYMRACRLPTTQTSERPAEDDQMLSAEVLRQACEPMALNGGLAAREADHSSPFGSYFSSSSSGSFGSDAGTGLFGARGSTASGVPLNQPVYVNTSLTASQRLDLYRQLVYPPCDAEPTLQMAR